VVWIIFLLRFPPPPQVPLPPHPIPATARCSGVRSKDLPYEVNTFRADDVILSPSPSLSISLHLSPSLSISLHLSPSLSISLHLSLSLPFPLSLPLSLSFLSLSPPPSLYISLRIHSFTVEGTNKRTPWLRYMGWCITVGLRSLPGGVSLVTRNIPAVTYRLSPTEPSDRECVLTRNNDAVVKIANPTSRAPCSSCTSATSPGKTRTTWWGGCTR
jgi:hypothetical protein